MSDGYLAEVCLDLLKVLKQPSPNPKEEALTLWKARGSKVAGIRAGNLAASKEILSYLSGRAKPCTLAAEVCNQELQTSFIFLLRGG